MVYAFVQDVAASWPHYQAVAHVLDGSAPAGLILHLAGPTDEGIRMIEIWANEQAWLRYGAERRDPVIAALGGPATAEPCFRELHPRHVVIGNTATPTTREGAHK